LLLRLADRQEHLLAGGAPGDFAPMVKPGGGLWHGHRMQAALAPVASPADARQRPRLEIGQHRCLAVVSARPRSFADRLRGRPGARAEIIELAVKPEASALSIEEGAGRTIVVADPDTWQAHWALFARLKAAAPVIFDGCGTAQFRALTGIRELPPPIVAHSGAVWVLSPDGTVLRAVF
jgi:DNA segregation ATPase FtsK/SpoIIIE, S-DNA-T family